MTNIAGLLAATASLATTPRVAIEHLFAAFNRHDLSIVIDGDQAAVRFTSSSDAPEHKFRFELMTYFRFRNGLIVEDDTIFDAQGRPCES